MKTTWETQEQNDRNLISLGHYVEEQNAINAPIKKNSMNWTLSGVPIRDGFELEEDPEIFGEDEFQNQHLLSGEA